MHSPHHLPSSVPPDGVRTADSGPRISSTSPKSPNSSKSSTIPGSTPSPSAVRRSARWLLLGSALVLVAACGTKGGFSVGRSERAEPAEVDAFTEARTALDAVVHGHAEMMASDAPTAEMISSVAEPDLAERLADTYRQRLDVRQVTSAVLDDDPWLLQDAHVIDGIGVFVTCIRFADFRIEGMGLPSDMKGPYALQQVYLLADVDGMDGYAAVAMSNTWEGTGSSCPEGPTLDELNDMVRDLGVEPFT